MSDFFNSGLSSVQFLQQFWQKKPLLIRQAIPHFQSPISADELAGLACEDEIESRLIQQYGETGSWQVKQGPFSDEDFVQLPPSNWTLLVQDADKHVPELQDLWSYFQFIPAWRRDDLMISFAPEGGSVGPHTDSYDVFLLQAQGIRRWQISDLPVVEASLLPGLDLKILAQFDADQQWDLAPGDMLYLPPNFAHYGVAQNECMTFSVGFRAPTQGEMLDSLINNLLEAGLDQPGYTDADLKINKHQAEIDEASLHRFKRVLHKMIDDAEPILARSMGRLFTETKPSLATLAEQMMLEQQEGADIAENFATGYCLRRNPYLRFAWQAGDASAELYLGGECYALEVEQAEFLSLLTEPCQLDQQDWQQIKTEATVVALLKQLIDAGGWYWEPVAV